MTPQTRTPHPLCGPSPRGRGRAAFTILELFVTLGLLTVIAMVAVRMTSTVIRISHDAPAEADRITWQTRMADQLRREIFAAHTIDVAPAAIKLTRRRVSDPGAIPADESHGSISDDGASTVVWQLSPNGTLTRKVTSPAGIPDRELKTFAPGAVFSATEDIVRLTGPGLELTFIAEHQRLARALQKGSPR